MKKIFIAFILFFITLGIVKAENLEYDWGKSLEDYRSISDVFERDYGYDIFAIDYYGYITTIKVNNEGEIIDTVYTNLYSYNYVFYDKNAEKYVTLYCDWIYTSGTYKRYVDISILDDNYEVEKNISEEIDNYFYPTFMNVTDSEYVFINMDEESILVVDKDLNSYELYSFSDVEKDIDELWGDYSIIADLVNESSSFKEYYKYEKNDKGYQLLHYSSDGEYGIELYDANDELLFRKRYYNSFAATIDDTGVYVLEEVDIDERDTEYCNSNDCGAYVKFTKYDFTGKELYIGDLQTMISDGYDYSWNNGRKISDIIVNNGSLLLISKYIESPTSLEDEITGHDPAIIQYSFTYDIESKTDGNGEIRIASTSKYGENVTYELTPLLGYSIENVKITDKNGNVIETTGNRFTMPASDVVVEATFSLKNPETSDMKMPILIVTLIAGAFLTIYNYKKLSFLR